MKGKRSYPADNGASIRFILTGSCQSGCNFCHLEGNRPPGYSTLHPDISGWKEKDKHLSLLQRLSYPVTDADVNFVINLAKTLRIRKIHLTGGEPTIHPGVYDFVRLFKRSDLDVAITTHGEYSLEVLEKLIRSGINSIVFSLHCITPEEYLTLDLIAQDIENSFGLEKSLIYAASKLAMKKKNILSCLDWMKRNQKFEVAVNHVLRSSSATIGVIRFCNEHGLPVRLQRDMNKVVESDYVIDDIISILNAKKTSEEIGFHDSSKGGSDYQYRLKNGQKGSFRLKDFSPIYLPLICEGCVLSGTARCREKFYGLRVQHGQVRLCIDRHDEKVLYDYKSIIENKHGVVTDLKKQYGVV